MVVSRGNSIVIGGYPFQFMKEFEIYIADESRMR